MAKHQSHADRSIALMERDDRVAKVESTLKKALTPLYTVSEVAEYLQVSPSTVYRMITLSSSATARRSSSAKASSNPPREASGWPCRSA